MEPKALIIELKRRRVFRALVAYGVLALAILQIIEPVMHGLHWPDAVLSYVIVSLGLGFPVVVSLAWIFALSLASNASVFYFFAALTRVHGASELMAECYPKKVPLPRMADQFHQLIIPFADTTMVATGLFGFLYFGMVDTAIPWAVFIAIVLSLIPHDIQYGPQAALIAESFTPRLRYSAYNIACGATASIGDMVGWAAEKVRGFRAEIVPPEQLRMKNGAGVCHSSCWLIPAVDRML